MSAEPLYPAAAGEGIDELLAKALRPLTVDVCVDPVTLDRIFTLHFEERSPLYIAVPAQQLTAILSNLAEATARSLN
jgi:hypothetical protein